MKFADRVGQTSTTTGTGTYSLNGSISGMQDFDAIGNGGLTTYLALMGTGWEIGLGTVTTGSPNQLARTKILDSSNGGAAVSWGAGTKSIYCAAVAAVFGDRVVADSFGVDKTGVGAAETDLGNAVTHAEAAGQQLLIPAGSYDTQAQIAIAASGDVAIKGDGRNTQLSYGFDVGSGVSAARVVEIEGLAGTDGHFVEVDQASTADMQFMLRDLFAQGAQSVMWLAGSGELSGFIQNIRGKSLTERGVGVGFNDYAAQVAGWGPFVISSVIIEGVDENASPASSKYGIICYARNSVIANFIVKNVGNTYFGGDVEGVYTKAPSSVIVGGVIVDAAGLSEGMLNIKGQTKGSVSNPQGYNVAAVGLVIEATDAYNAAHPAPTSVAGANLASDNVLFGSAILFNHKGRAIHTASSELENLTIHDILIDEGDNSDGAIYLQSSGRGHTVRGATIRNHTGPAVKIRGADADSTFDLSDFVIDGGSYGVLIRPITTADLVDVTLRDFAFRNTAAAKLYFDSSVNPRSVTLIDVDFSDLSVAAINYDTSIRPNKWFVRNAHGRLTTVGGTAETAFAFRLPNNKPMSFTLRATASDGIDTYHIEQRACYFNNAGTPGLIGAAVDVINVASGGVSGWAAAFDVSGELVRIRITGQSGHTIDWTISVDAESP